MMDECPRAHAGFCDLQEHLEVLVYALQTNPSWREPLFHGPHGVRIETSDQRDPFVEARALHVPPLLPLRSCCQGAPNALVHSVVASLEIRPCAIRSNYRTPDRVLVFLADTTACKLKLRLSYMTYTESAPRCSPKQVSWDRAER